MADTPNMDPNTEAALKGLFDDLKDNTAPASDAIMARVLADAYDAIPAPAPAPAPARPHRSWDIFRSFGGIMGTSVIAASAVLGISVGYIAPDRLYEIPGVTSIEAYLGATSEITDETDIFSTDVFMLSESEF